MATSDPIKHTDIAEEGAVRDYLQKEFQELLALLPTVEKSIKDFAQKTSDELRGLSKDLSLGTASLETVKKINEATRQATEVAIAQAKVQKIKIDLNEREIAQAQIDKKLKKDRIDLLKAEIIEMDKTVGTLQRVEAANTRLRLERKKLDTDTKEGAQRLKEINAELDKNNAYIKENSDKLKQQKLNVGNYTESIKKAFEGTGALGEVVGKYLNVITLLSEKIEGVVQAFTAQKTAQDAATVATETATEAEQAQVLVTEEGTVAAKANIETTEAQAAANEGLLGSLKKLATNPYVIGAAALAAFTKIIYDNVTAVQANKDELDSDIEAVKAFLKTFDLGITSSILYAAAVKQITDEVHKLADAEIGSIRTIAGLRAEAAKAREESTEEGKTTRERIILLGEYIEKSKEAANIEIEHAKESAKIAKSSRIALEIAGKESREARKAEEEAAAHVDELEREKNFTFLRAQKQRTSLIEKYNDDTRNMLQEAQRQELEIIDSYSKYQAEHLTKELSKELKILKLDTEQKVENKRREQEKLGAIDADGVDHTADFARELLAIQHTGDAKAKELTKKTHDDIEKLNEDYHFKQLDAQHKFADEMRKLDEAYIKSTGIADKQAQDNELQSNQIEIDHQQQTITDLQDKRNEEIVRGKNDRHLTLSDLKQYFDQIDRLEKEHYERSKRKIQDESDFNKYQTQNTANDAVQSVKEKYSKIAEEDQKAIDNKTTDPKKRKEESDTHKAELAKKQAEEIEKINRQLAIDIANIDEKLKGDLSKADEDELKRQREVLKQKKDLTKQEIEDQKKLAEERRKLTAEITDGVADGLQKRADIQQQADQKDIDYHNRLIEVQSKLAAAGQQNILAEEQARATKAEEKKIQDAKKAQKQQESVALTKIFLDTLQKSLDGGDNFLKAFAKAAAAEGLVASSISKLISGSYYEGTESTGKVNSPLDSNGGRLSVIHDDERIVPKKLNDKITGMSNEELISNALMFEQVYKPQFAAANVTVMPTPITAHDSIMTAMLSQKLDSVQKAIENKPVQSIEINGLREVVETVKRAGITTKTHYLTRSNRRSLRLNG